MIDKNIPLTTGMVIRNDVFTNRLFEIIKLGRKYATVTRYPGLPQIDRSNKVLFTQIYTDYSIRKERASPAECVRNKERKDILIESATGIRSTIDISADRDPLNYIIHNAPNCKYIDTVRHWTHK